MVVTFQNLNIGQEQALPVLEVAFFDGNGVVQGGLTPRVATNTLRNAADADRWADREIHHKAIFKEVTL